MRRLVGAAAGGCLVTSVVASVRAYCDALETDPVPGEFRYGGHNAATMRDADEGWLARSPLGAAVLRGWRPPGADSLSQARIDTIARTLLDPAFLASLQATNHPVVHGRAIEFSSYDSNRVVVLVDADAPIIELIDSGGDPSDLRFRVRESGSRTLARLRNLQRSTGN